MKLRLTINARRHDVDVPDGMPLLWVLRDELRLTGTKYGCGVGACGACTVHLDGRPIRSCSIPASAAVDRRITTIEGMTGPVIDRLREAWLEEDVAQCGYCQTGQLMTAANLLATTPQPSDAQIDATMSGHICRCGAYQRIRRAIHRAAGSP